MDQNNKASIYHAIQTAPLKVTEAELALHLESARFDPRLYEVLTELMRDYWWNFDSSKVNEALKKNRSPYAIKPALSAIISQCSFSSEELKRVFEDWSAGCTKGIENPNPQLFYIALNKIGSPSMQREVDENQSYFSEFNLISKDSPFNKGFPGEVPSMAEMVFHHNKWKMSPVDSGAEEISGDAKGSEDDSVYSVSRQVAEGGSWKIHFFNFVDAFRRTRDLKLIADPPSIELPEKESALISSIVCELCHNMGIEKPEWAIQKKYLKEPWFVAGVERLKPMAIVESSPWFIRNNIFVLANFLDRA